MLQFLTQCIKRFGFISGLNIWIRIKVFRFERVHLPGYTRPLYFRQQKADLVTFREIFLREEYAIDLPANTVETIIDAGANIGFTTTFLARRFPNARIISLEPDAENFRYLEKNTRHNSNIYPIQAALWNKNGAIAVVDKGYGPRGFIVEDVDPESGGNVMTSVTLDALINKYGITRIDILKIDIEGSEKEVFDANPAWLKITRCLVIELHDRMKEGCSLSVLAAIENHNFEKSTKGENLVFTNNELTID